MDIVRVSDTKSNRKTALFAAILWTIPNASFSGPYQDDLIRCVGTHLVDADKSNFAAFISLSVSRLPEMKDVIFIDKIRADSIVKSYVETLERLYLIDCHEQSKLVVKWEGAQTLFAASHIVGEMAMREKLAAPEVAQLFDEMDKYSSSTEWEKLLQQ